MVTQPDTLRARELARAADDLRRGEPVVVRDGDAAISVQAVERGDGAALGLPDVLITERRAGVLKLTNQLPAAGTRAVRVVRDEWVKAGALADPVDDLATPFKGPFRTAPMGAAARAGEAALALAKRAGLLPALFVADGGLEGAMVVEAADVLGWRRAAVLQVVARARLPLVDAPDTQVTAFRALGDAGPDHLALVINGGGEAPLVRLHSACLTGDLLGSLKCDCGPQLQAAIRAIGADRGVLLYLQQEGRGIGLANKLRAYALQDQGFDTVDANWRLGFEDDERDFDLGAAMLRALGVARIRLLTNNPLKVNAFEAAGITVIERVPHQLPPNPHNAAYLNTKRDRQGHQL